MGLRDRLRRIERATAQDQYTYRCSACGETWTTPGDTFFDYSILCYEQVWAERNDTEGPEPEGYLQVLETHIAHLGEGDEIRDMTDGRRVVPPPEEIVGDMV